MVIFFQGYVLSSWYFSVLLCSVLFWIPIIHSKYWPTLNVIHILMTPKDFYHLFSDSSSYFPNIKLALIFAHGIFFPLSTFVQAIQSFCRALWYHSSLLLWLVFHSILSPCLRTLIRLEFWGPEDVIAIKVHAWHVSHQIWLLAPYRSPMEHRWVKP